VVQQRARLPLSLVIRPCQPVKNAVYKLTIDTNKSTVNLGEMFSGKVENISLIETNLVFGDN
jgi:PTHB1 C-terminus